MARNAELLAVRNTRIQADYVRLKATEVIVSNRGEKSVIRLTYAQILSVLEESHCISRRTLEAIVIATTPKPAKITSLTPTPATV